MNKKSNALRQRTELEQALQLQPADRPLQLAQDKGVAVILLNICDTFDCDAGIDNFPELCGQGKDFGQKIVAAFLARNDADDLFADNTELTTESEWQTRLDLSPSGPNASNRIVSIKNIYTGIKPAADKETVEAPDGGTELVNMTKKLTGELQRLNEDVIDWINDARCRNPWRLWYLTNTGWLFGSPTGFSEVSILWDDIQHAGIGQGRAKVMFEMSWRGLDSPSPVYAPFLRTIQPS